MIKVTFFLILYLLVNNCNLNKITKSHGIQYLEKKQNEVFLNQNKNEIRSILGPPSTVSTFDENTWFYLEKEISGTKVTKLGKTELNKNNILVLKFDNRGILVEKDFFDKNDLREIEFEKNTTTTDINKRSVIGQFLYGIKQKIDDPLGLKRKGLNKK
ncbi:outer membrane protein assembly factor BamE domain-containing protein [Candidatus Pelagibacter sp.]|uniref:outer membrane protein assembly factor BamE domain-containing protein n=1 Tax=Candidatus Pelagibacter sp. TaxID=2024849 RepID=UPI003F878490